MKARFAFTLEIDVESYARSEGIDTRRVRIDAFAYVTSALYDLAGIADTDARLRWYVRNRKTLEDGAPARLPRGAPMKLHLETTIIADRQGYSEWAEVPACEARRDLIAYITHEIPWLPVLANARVRVLWQSRPARGYHRVAPWPARRREPEFGG